MILRVVTLGGSPIEFLDLALPARYVSISIITRTPFGLVATLRGRFPFSYREQDPHDVHRHSA